MYLQCDVKYHCLIYYVCTLFIQSCCSVFTLHKSSILYALNKICVYYHMTNRRECCLFVNIKKCLQTRYTVTYTLFLPHLLVVMLKYGAGLKVKCKQTYCLSSFMHNKCLHLAVIVISCDKLQQKYSNKS